MAARTALVCLFAFLSIVYGAQILVGPTQTYKTPKEAIAYLKSGDEMIIDDGTYKGAFDIPPEVTDWTIRSASGNPYACVLDGQGGGGDGSPTRLAWGKGIIHTRAPGTIRGLGFINGGGSDGKASGEAGIYAESFATSSTLNIVNCAFDGNENGIFSPAVGTQAAPEGGVNVKIRLDSCIFSKNKGNGIDGYAHNYYISCAELYSVGCTHMPSYLGNNGKSRSPIIHIEDLYNQHDQGRCLDIPSGGKLTIKGGIYTSVGDSAVSNFFSYAAENTISGLYPPSADGLKIYCNRNNDKVWNNAPSVNWAFTNIQQFWKSGCSLNLDGPITGLTASGTNLADVPAPVYPAWLTGGGSPTSAATPTPTTKPATNAPSSTNSPSTNSPTNAPATNSPSTNAPATNSPSTNAPTTSTASTPAPSTTSKSATSVPTTKPVPSASSTTKAPADSAAASGAVASFVLCSVVLFVCMLA